MSNLMFKLLFISIFSLFSLTLAAKDAIEVTEVSMPEIPPVSRTAAIYLKLHNNTDDEIILTNVSTDVAHHAMIHLSQDIDGIAKMQHIDELKIPANSQFEFSTNGYHIMLMGLDKTLLSAPFEVKLEFKNYPTKIFVVSI